MADEEHTEKPIFQPSKLPGDREYEKARAEQRRLFEPSKPPTNKKSGEAEARAGYRTERLNAKTQVLKMIPDLLTEYRESLGKDETKRDEYSRVIFRLVLGWLIVVVVLTVLSQTSVEFQTGSNTWSLDFALSDAVLVALISGAAVSLIGLLGTVISYFFTRSQEQVSLYNGVFKAMLDDEKSNEEM